MINKLFNKKFLVFSILLVALCAARPMRWQAITVINGGVVEEDEVSALNFTTGVEKDTGQTLDGAKIYIKYINFGAGVNNSTKLVAHGITGLDKVLQFELIMDSGGGGFQYPNTWTNTTPTSGTYSYHIIDDTNIRQTSNTNWSSYTCIAMVKYTKS